MQSENAYRPRMIFCVEVFSQSCWITRLEFVGIQQWSGILGLMRSSITSRRDGPDDGDVRPYKLLKDIRQARGYSCDAGSACMGPILRDAVVRYRVVENDGGDAFGIRRWDAECWRLARRFVRIFVSSLSEFGQVDDVRRPFAMHTRLLAVFGRICGKQQR